MRELKKGCLKEISPEKEDCQSPTYRGHQRMLPEDDTSCNGSQGTEDIGISYTEIPLSPGQQNCRQKNCCKNGGRNIVGGPAP